MCPVEHKTKPQTLEQTPLRQANSIPCGGVKACPIFPRITHPFHVTFPSLFMSCALSHGDIVASGDQ